LAIIQWYPAPIPLKVTFLSLISHEFGDDVGLVGMQVTRGGKAAARNGHASS
jgi:hypothetical protein